MAVTQYIGARYVPVFANPAEWDNVRTYEPLTIVLYQGNSYTSRQYVPSQIDLFNEDYWAETGNYNAQVEAYRREVIDYSKIVDKYKDDTDAIIEEIRNEVATFEQSLANEATARKSEDDKLANSVTQLASDVKATTDALKDTDTQLANDIQTNASNIQTNASNIQTNASNISEHSISIARTTGKFEHMIFLGDSWGNGYSKGANHTDQGLAKYLADMCGSTLINASVNGAGFVRGGDYNRNFAAQWNNIPIADRKAADIIVIAGGQNDMGAGTSEFMSAYLGLYNAINRDKNPIARVYVFPFMFSQGRTFAGSAQGSDVPADVKNFAQICNYSTEANAYVCESCYRWTSVFGSENIDDAWHLTASGYYRYAQHMYDFILTGQEFWPVNYAQLIVPSTITLDSYRNNEVYEINGNVTVRFAARATNEIVGSQVLATIPSNMAYGHVFYTTAGYDIPNFISWDVGEANGITVCTLQIQGDASIPAGSWFFLNVTYPASM